VSRRQLEYALYGGSKWVRDNAIEVHNPQSAAQIVTQTFDPTVPPAPFTMADQTNSREPGARIAAQPCLVSSRSCFCLDRLFHVWSLGFCAASATYFICNLS